jgi:acetylornithine deacetylase/succinyl-diaminopimelate desuccinylase-like protein
MAALDDVLKQIDKESPASLDRLFELLRIHSISTDPAYRDSCRRAADWLVDELSELGFDASARETPGHPIVVAHDREAGVGPHVLFYAHYDVQPVDPLDLWERPPFEPRLVERPDGSKVIAARGASDDKGQLMTFVEACRAWKAVSGRLPVKVSMVLEGEEESGSNNLAPFLKENAAELTADVALICDTGMWNATRPAITTMLRGLVGQEVTVTAASRDLHSGIYGSAARNPIHVLAAILADLHDDKGRVTLPGFYDDVPELPAEIKKQWDGLGFDAAKFLAGIGLSVPAGEEGRSVLEMVWSRPTAEVNGVIGGYTGSGFKTVIPSKASAKVSFRLVGDQDPERIASSFQDFVRARLPADCTAEFIAHGGSPAIRLPLAGAHLTAARRALAEEWGADPALVGSGGSIPVAGDFQRILGLDSLMIGFALEDDRIHSPNEKYNLSSFEGGIRSWARILGALGG